MEGAEAEMVLHELSFSGPRRENPFITTHAVVGTHLKTSRMAVQGGFEMKVQTF